MSIQLVCSFQARNRSLDCLFGKEKHGSFTVLLLVSVAPSYPCLLPMRGVTISSCLHNKALGKLSFLSKAHLEAFICMQFQMKWIVHFQNRDQHCQSWISYPCKKLSPSLFHSIFLSRYLWSCASYLVSRATSQSSLSRSTHANVGQKGTHGHR